MLSDLILFDSNRMFKYIEETKEYGFNFSTDLLVHGYNVGTISYAIAKEMGLDNYSQMLMIGILHDVGKNKIPSSILFKPSKLTVEEFEIMKCHASYSEELVRMAIKGEKVNEVAKIIRHHHENWDGTGYPDCLKGTDIPIESRILSIADVYDAIVQPRVYRPYSIANPIDVLEELVGSKFDADLFKIAKPILKKFHNEIYLKE